MKLLTRSVIIITIFALFSLCVGCPNICFFEIEINRMDISLVDNTGQYPNFDADENQLRESIAFAIKLSDSVYYSDSYAHISRKPISFFTETYAWTCEEQYAPSNSISEISISTVYDFSSDIKANDDVTHLFVADFKRIIDQGLYLKIPQIIESFNNIPTFGSSSIPIFFFLTTPLEADSARFSVEVKLSNQTVLFSTTPKIKAKN